MTDPFRRGALEAGDSMPEWLRSQAEPLRGEPAFDPEEIRRAADGLAFSPEIRFAHRMLERAVRVGLAHIDATFDGNHPRYGVGRYANPIHDGFPPTIIAAVDALSLWERRDRAEELFGYWLARFVRDDGSIDYYGPSLSEYGQLLAAARKLAERGAGADRLAVYYGALARMADRLRALLRQGGAAQLLEGAPEADEADRPATYFHNNAWAERGLRDWAFLLDHSFRDSATAERVRRDADDLHALLMAALEAAWPDDPADWRLRPMAGPEAPTGYFSFPKTRVTENRLGSYANYRYWPELLSSGVLPRVWMERIVHARLNGGGQYLGMTRFEGHLDDWPLADYLEGLWTLGRTADYRLSLWGHLWFHQAEGHLTAYEQVSLPPGERVADYCLPCQLAAVRAARRLVSGQGFQR
jgi:hypothetical protein